MIGIAGCYRLVRERYRRSRLRRLIYIVDGNGKGRVNTLRRAAAVGCLQANRVTGLVFIIELPAAKKLAAGHGESVVIGPIAARNPTHQGKTVRWIVLVNRGEISYQRPGRKVLVQVVSGQNDLAGRLIDIQDRYCEGQVQAGSR